MGRMRLAPQISDAARGPQGYVPISALSGDWEQAFAEALVGPGEEKQLAMAPSKLSACMTARRSAFDAASSQGEPAVLVCSGSIRAHVRAVVERFRPATSVLAHNEIHARARIRTIGTVQ